MRWIIDYLVPLAAQGLIATLVALRMRRSFDRRTAELQVQGMAKQPDPETLKRLYLALVLGLATFLALGWW